MSKCQDSPKRLKRPLSTSLLDAFSMEPSLLDTILSYVPSTNATDIKKTVANVCLALPRSHELLLDCVRPSNQAFWRQLVLATFNFEVDLSDTFNVEDYGESSGDYYSEDREILRIVKKWRRANNYAEVEDYLLESLACWEHLDVYFRPSQYGFLRAIQEGELPMDAWPDHEDAFTLFCDLSTLIDEFNAFEDLRTCSDGEQYVYPCLLGAMQKPMGPRMFGMLEHCGIAPHFWANRSSPVHQWAEFGGEVTADGIAFPRCEK